MTGIRIGISGWTYKPWRGDFYPEGLPHKRELAYASSIFNSIEVNGTFYGLQRPKAFADWAEATPADFVFAVKGSRYITHMLKLKNVGTPLANFFASGVLRLRDKLGPILWQFPPQLGFDAERFAAFFALLPRDSGAALALARRHDERLDGRAWLEIDHVRPLRHAVEIRHPSFVDPASGLPSRRTLWTYRVGVIANAHRDPAKGGLVLLSQPIDVNGP